MSESRRHTSIGAQAETIQALTEKMSHSNNKLSELMSEHQRVAQADINTIPPINAEHKKQQDALNKYQHDEAKTAHFLALAEAMAAKDNKLSNNLGISQSDLLNVTKEYNLSIAKHYNPEELTTQQIHLSQRIEGLTLGIEQIRNDIKNNLESDPSFYVSSSEELQNTLIDLKKTKEDLDVRIAQTKENFEQLKTTVLKDLDTQMRAVNAEMKAVHTQLMSLKKEVRRNSTTDLMRGLAGSTEEALARRSTSPEPISEPNSLASSTSTTPSTTPNNSPPSSPEGKVEHPEPRIRRRG